MELALDQFERLQTLLMDLREEAGEMRTELALLRQEATHTKEHLARLNGRVGKSEDRLSAIETAAIEARGAWKAAAAVASIVGGAASWLLGVLSGAK
jgi:predicted nuclease with TOPRIM domain